MTDREPDDLYDALRDRLTDYGQEPPAPLWAGIKAQLPPPVAQPQLRPKRRRTPVVLLLLLLATASGVGWQWWQAQSLKHSTPDLVVATMATETTTSAGQKSKSIRTEAAATALPARPGEIAGNNPAASANATGGPFASTSASNATTGGTATAVALADTAGPGANSPAASGAKEEMVAKRGAMLATASKAASSRQPASGPVHGRTDASTAFVAPGTATARRARGLAKISSAASNTSTISTRNSTRRATTASRWTPETGSLAGVPTARQTPAVATAPAKRQVVSPKYPVASSEQVPDAQLANASGQSATAQAGVAAREADTSALTASQQSMNSTGLPDELSAEELARLQARAALLHLPIGQVLPQPQLTVIVPDKSAATFLPRWAVQVLVGPALTYRQLSNPLLQSTSLTSVNSPAQYTSRQSPTNIAELERPALGTGAQANVRRSLTEHWTVSAGLGYSEYATRLALQQVRSPTTLTNTNMAPLADSSTTSIHTRDVYRFVTLPLRVGYTWTLTPRWRMGLLAGADVALYMGGSSTEGSPCACQAQAWGASNSPYRRVSLGASLGVEMRYRLNGRWELLAQPTGTYLLTPLAQSTTAYYRRHLLGGTALLGAAYTLP